MYVRTLACSLALAILVVFSVRTYVCVFIEQLSIYCDRHFSLFWFNCYLIRLTHIHMYFLCGFGAWALNLSKIFEKKGIQLIMMVIWIWNPNFSFEIIDAMPINFNNIIFNLSCKWISQWFMLTLNNVCLGIFYFLSWFHSTEIFKSIDIPWNERHLNLKRIPCLLALYFIFMHSCNAIYYDTKCKAIEPQHIWILSKTKQNKTEQHSTAQCVSCAECVLVRMIIIVI